MSHGKPSHVCPAQASEAGAAGEADIAAQIKSLTSAGKCKQAVELAKEYHKRTQTPQSQQVLVDAYVARIQQFQAKGSVEDACTLINLVRERFPEHQAALAILEIRAAAAQGRVDDFLRPLANPDVQPEMREAIESIIRQEWVDLPLLADATVLPSDHPLRTASLALWRAFDGVTARTVSEEQISLPEVSRRSPLAGWKLLIRGIDAFYRNDNEACRRALQGIAPDAAVQRLAPVLTAMMGGTPVEPHRLKAVELKSHVVVDDKPLRDALADLEGAFDSYDARYLERSIRDALGAASQYAPELLPRLRQLINARCALLEIPDAVVRRVLGMVPRDAYYWRSSAIGHGHKGAHVFAALHWERFLRHAVHEKWFAGDSATAAAVYLRAAEASAKVPVQQLRTLCYQVQTQKIGVIANTYRGQPPEIAALAPKNDAEVYDIALNPLGLFEKSARLDPYPETFAAWLAWSRNANQPDAGLQDIANLWREKLPRDPRAPLLLSTLAEFRGALKLALKHLAEAEAIDAMNPAVRKARLRLTLATAWRHLKEKKPHLFEKDIAELDALPAMHAGDRTLLLDTMRVALHLLKGDRSAARSSTDSLVQRAGPFLVSVLMDSVADTARLGGLLDWPTVPNIALPDPHAIVDAEARAGILFFDLDIVFKRPHGWDTFITQVLKERPTRVSSANLITLARLAANRKSFVQAYLATGAGLQTAIGTAAARFLLLRARSVAGISYLRAAQCLRTAMELARQANDGELISEISERISADEEVRDLLAAAPRPTQQWVAEVMTKERQAEAFPRTPQEAARAIVSMGAEVYSRRRFAPDTFMDADDEEDEFDEEDDDFDDEQDDDEAAFNFLNPGGSLDSPDAEFLEEFLNQDPRKAAETFQKTTGMKLTPEMVQKVLDRFKKFMKSQSAQGRGRER